MKITLVLAAVAAYVYAGEGDCCEDLEEYDPKCIPEALEGSENWSARFTLREREGKKPKKIGDEALKMKDLRQLQNR